MGFSFCLSFRRRGNAAPEEKRLVEVFHQAIDCYERRNWKEAMEAFRESLSIEGEGGNASEVYLKRCQSFLTNPPAENWDGVYNLTEK